MIVFEKQGNIFDCTLQALVCPVNTVFTMGKGLALQFKNAYPGLDRVHKQACAAGVLQSQGFAVWNAPDGHKIVLVPTKRHWRNPSRIEWIDRSLERMALHYDQHDITSMAIPAIGCGEGGLEWPQVRSVILTHFADHPLQVGIYTP